jgi:DNA-binding transcriptional MerR regulator
MIPHPERSDAVEEITYSLGTAARLTGLSPDLLRAWERRYGVVEPLRTPGGTRRYRASDLERLRLVKAAVDAGHRVGQVAALDREALERCVAAVQAGRGVIGPELEPVLSALDRLDAVEAERLIALQLSSLGPSEFARSFAIPLLRAIGEGWLRQRLCIAGEHLGSALLRTLLGSALRPTAASRMAPLIVFGTPPGERHELGLLMAALTALGAGGNPLYLGCDLPVEELVRAAKQVEAPAVAIGLVALPAEEAQRCAAALRGALPSDVEVWAGGGRAGEVELPPGVQAIDSLARLEQQVALLCARVG